MKGSTRGVMAKVLGSSLKVNEFKFRSRFYVHFQNNTDPFILPAPCWIVSLLFFNKYGFGIK